MRTIPFVVKYGYNADFAGQPPGWVIRRFFPNHGGAFFDRLPVLSEDHRQGWLRNDLVHRFADQRFPAQSGDSQQSRVGRNEAESTFRFDSQVENAIPDGVVNRDQLLFAFAQGFGGLFQCEVRLRYPIDAGTEVENVPLAVAGDAAADDRDDQQIQVYIEYGIVARTHGRSGPRETMFDGDTQRRHRHHDDARGHHVRGTIQHHD